LVRDLLLTLTMKTILTKPRDLFLHTASGKLKQFMIMSRADQKNFR